MSSHTAYGFCIHCEKWVPRDEMMSINIDIYDEENKSERVRVRSCPKCHAKRAAELRKLNWDNVLRSESEIRGDPDLVKQSDLEFDDSEAAMRAAGFLWENDKQCVDKR